MGKRRKQAAEKRECFNFASFIEIVGNGFTKEGGKCRGGGKYVSVDLVIRHNQAASAGLLRG